MHVDKEIKSLDCTLIVAISASDSLLAKSVFRDCMLRVSNNDMVTDLIPLDMHDFDFALVMNWLENYHTTKDCFRKEITFRKFEETDIIFCGERQIFSSCVIFTISTKRLLMKGYFAYLAHVINIRVSYVKLKDILVVKKYM